MTPTLVEIPRRRLGPATVPRLFLGDHGYLAKLDSTLTVDQVAESMRSMLATASVGLSAGETRVIDTAVNVLAGREDRSLMIHSDLHALLRGERIRYRHLAATTTERLSAHGLDLTRDPVLGFLYDIGGRGSTISLRHHAGLELDADALQGSQSEIRRAKPCLVSVGGDWLDLLLLMGRGDLAAAGLTQLAHTARSIGAAVLATTYVGAVIAPTAIAPIIDLVDGLLVPLNRSGFGMLPNAAEHLSWLAGVDKPVLGMHVLAGESTPASALMWLDLPMVAALVIGASSASHQLALVAEANRYFGGAVR
ncbi:hypothetical protein ACWEOW_01095 [Monashia sp. NPDC004114]